MFKTNLKDPNIDLNNGKTSPVLGQNSYIKISVLQFMNLMQSKELYRTSLVAQNVKNLPAMQETQV